MTSTDADKVRQTWVRVKFWRRGGKKKGAQSALRLADETEGKAECASPPVRLHLRVVRAPMSSLLTPGRFCIITARKGVTLRNIKHEDSQSAHNLCTAKKKQKTKKTHGASLFVCSPHTWLLSGWNTEMKVVQRAFPSPPLTVLPVHMWLYECVFMRFLSYFFLRAKKKVDTLRHCILSPQPSLQSKWRLCDCFSDSFSLLPWFGAVLMLRRKNTLLFLSPNRWICYQQFAA